MFFINTKSFILQVQLHTVTEISSSLFVILKDDVGVDPRHVHRTSEEERKDGWKIDDNEKRDPNFVYYFFLVY